MRNSALYLLDVVEAADDIAGFTKQTDAAGFPNNKLVQSAVLQKVMVIGEASSRISGDLRLRYAQIPWKQIIGFRNIAAHAYFSLNWSEVWGIATRDIPVLRLGVIGILSSEFPEYLQKYLGQKDIH